MDKQNQTAEQQVWQRVRANREEMPGRDLLQLQREAMELAAIYRNLSTRMTGRQQELVKRLWAGARANGEALAGIRMLSGQNAEQLKLWQPGKEETKKLLQQCYHRTRRCMTEYLARSVDGEVGVVFDGMARREGEHCLLIAQLLGGL